ncbi:MAG: cation:proton antiporter [bacterium]
MHEGFLFLQYLALILLGGKLAAEGFSRFGISPVLGEIFAGFLLGPSCLGIVDLATGGESGAIVLGLAEVGILFLMFTIGLETRLGQIAQVGLLATAVAVGGVVLPLVLGYAVGVWMVPEEGWRVHLFIGAITTATSVAITARVLRDLGIGRSRASRIILAAAILDDILGLVILSIVLAVGGTSSGHGAEGDQLPGAAAVLKSWLGIESNVLSTAAAMALFLVVLVPLLWRAVPRLLESMRKLESKGSLQVVASSLMLLVSYLADLCGLAPIVGAFLLGMIVGSSQVSRTIEEQTEAIFLLLAPVFFVSIGITFEIGHLFSAWEFALVLTAAAVLSKGLGTGLPARLAGSSNREALLVGLGMIPRGEVGLIVANVGLAAGLLSQPVYAGSVAMCILTVLVIPPVLKLAAKDYGGAQVEE